MVAAIVSTGGLTEAAHDLGKSQPSLSRSLSMLEKRIGAPLFLPGRRPLQPTELGKALAEAGQRIVDARQDASHLVRTYLSGQRGNVRIGGTPLFMDGVVSTMIADFQTQFPDVRLDQSYGYADELIMQLQASTLDLAVCPLQGTVAPENLIFEPILPGMNVVACRSGHPLTRRGIVTPKDIATYPWIAPPTESPLFADLQRSLANFGTDLKISFSGGSLSAVVSILAGTESLTILPFSVVFMMRQQRRIEALSLRIEHPDRALGLLYARERKHSPATLRARSFFRSRFVSLTKTILQHQQNMIWRGT